jgi:RHS repeat-associated protein
MVPTGAAYYVYADDEDGRLLGEYDANGNALYEVIYLRGTPVGVITPTGLYYIYADHIDTPRVIARNSDHAIVWRWDEAEAFGATPPNEDPNGLGTFTLNMRFPGQVYDRETGLFYNWHRDYRPSDGRYAQADPIGQAGGVNLFIYVGGNPLSFADPTGLDKTYWRSPSGRNSWDGGPRNGNWCGGNWSGGQVPSANGGKDGPAPPLDSMDSCCMVHDQCYAKCEALPKGSTQEACLITCDQSLTQCLKKLNDDCTRWPNPPKQGTESDSQQYRDDAIRIFDRRVDNYNRSQRRPKS